MFLIYPFAVLLSIFFWLTAMFPMNFICAALVDKNGNLPRYLSYYQTFDSSIPNDSYLAALTWLYRNPTYGFDYFLLGASWVAQDWKVWKYSSTSTTDLFIAYTSSGLFNIYYCGFWGTYKLGWKAWNFYVPKLNQFSGTWGPSGKVPLCFSPIPFKSKQ